VDQALWEGTPVTSIARFLAGHLGDSSMRVLFWDTVTPEMRGILSEFAQSDIWVRNSAWQTERDWSYRRVTAFL
jgi:hypothetical protein